VSGSSIEFKVEESLKDGGLMELISDDLSEEIQSIYFFNTTKNTDTEKKVIPKIALKFKVDLPQVKKIKLKDFKLTFPKCLILDDADTGKGELDSEKNTYSIPISDIFFATAHDNVHTDDDGDKVFNLDLKQITFEDAEGKGLDISKYEDEDGTKKGKLEYPLVPTGGGDKGKNIFLECTITDITLSGSVEEGETFKLTPIVTIDDVPIASVSGKVKVNMEPTRVALDGLPDFLQDDEVILSLADPRINLYINNKEIELPIDINISMQGKTKEEEGKALRTTAEVETPKPTPIKIYQNITSDEPEPIKLSNVNIPNFSELFILQKDKDKNRGGVPDSIILNISVIIDKDPNPIHAKQTIDLRGDEEENKYKVEMDSYEIDMPLSFGGDFAIVFKDTIDGWNDNLKDSDIKGISLKLDIDNAIPLALSIGGYAIGKDIGIGKDRKIDGIEITSKDLIKAGKVDATGEPESVPTTGIKISIKGSGEKMKKMDGVVLTFTARTSSDVEEEPLKSSQFLKINNIGATINGGVSVDLN
jgi:hypothetical protein